MRGVEAHRDWDQISVIDVQNAEHSIDRRMDPAIIEIDLGFVDGSLILLDERRCCCEIRLQRLIVDLRIIFVFSQDLVPFDFFFAKAKLARIVLRCLELP